VDPNANEPWKRTPRKHTRSMGSIDLDSAMKELNLTSKEEIPQEPKVNDSLVVRELKRFYHKGIIGFCIGAAIAFSFCYLLPLYAPVFWPFIL
jgi:hypothetical protein